MIDSEVKQLGIVAAATAGLAWVLSRNQPAAPPPPPSGPTQVDATVLDANGQPATNWMIEFVEDPDAIGFTPSAPPATVLVVLRQAGTYTVRLTPPAMVPVAASPATITIADHQTIEQVFTAVPYGQAPQPSPQPSPDSGLPPVPPGPGPNPTPTTTSGAIRGSVGVNTTPAA